jgi:hypothetical protein
MSVLHSKEQNSQKSQKNVPIKWAFGMLKRLKQREKREQRKDKY